VKWRSGPELAGNDLKRDIVPFYVIDIRVYTETGDSRGTVE